MYNITSNSKSKGLRLTRRIMLKSCRQFFAAVPYFFKVPSVSRTCGAGTWLKQQCSSTGTADGSFMQNPHLPRPNAINQNYDCCPGFGETIDDEVVTSDSATGGSSIWLEEGNKNAG